MIIKETKGENLIISNKNKKLHTNQQEKSMTCSEIEFRIWILAIIQHARWAIPATMPTAGLWFDRQVTRVRVTAPPHRL